jgi:ferredoxin--NADP+ reductase
VTFVIAQGCCSDASCVAVCPVQCIRPRPGDPDFTTAEQLYIDADTCIDCGLCFDACPVSAVHSDADVPEELVDYLEINAEYFASHPLATVGRHAPDRRTLPVGTELRVAIVGTGPAACYTAEALSSTKGTSITMLERLPVPFGLVRAGVAPDHTDTKKIAERFTEVLDRPNVTCFFNVTVGADVSVEELLEFHHAVVWATGASAERRLEVPGEDLDGVHSAHDFLAWCNGHPDMADASFDLHGERVVVIGNGNVALDAARTLLRPVEDFEMTDMAEHARRALAKSNVREVVVVGRRGPEHAAFSLSQLLDLDRVDGLKVVTEQSDWTVVPGDRKLGAIAAAAERDDSRGRVIRLRFGMRPVVIEGKRGSEAVVFLRPDGTTERIEASLVLRAIGHVGAPIAGLPFDAVLGTVPNQTGRVVEPDQGEIPGIYCAGWIKRGARGGIGDNRQDAEETVASLVDDLASGRLTQPTRTSAELAELLATRVEDLIDKHAWGRIDAEEQRRGREVGRSRVKLVTVPELLAASRSG